jgi:hypothetical protein
VAFNWHNQFLELDVEPELGGFGIAPGRMPSPRAATPATGGS